jgi:hypothetical protein
MWKRANKIPQKELLAVNHLNEIVDFCDMAKTDKPHTLDFGHPVKLEVQ